MSAEQSVDQANITPTAIVTFWREAGRDKWYTKDEAFDADIRARFLATHEAGRARKTHRLGKKAPKARSRC